MGIALIFFKVGVIFFCPKIWKSRRLHFFRECTSRSESSQPRDPGTKKVENNLKIIANLFCHIKIMCYLCIVIKKQNEMKKKSDNDNDLVKCERDGYGFRYYFNAGVNKETLACDEEGIEVFEKDCNGDFHFVADIPCGYNVDDIKDMTDDEFNEFLTENGIF